jgi:hypothetical protein
MEADDVRKSLSLWADEVLRREYLAQLRWRLFLDSDSLPPPLPMGQIYFPLDLISLSSEEVFVDCGAFDGDSVRNFIQRQRSTFRQIIAIEMVSAARDSGDPVARGATTAGRMSASFLSALFLAFLRLRVESFQVLSETL